MASDLQPVPKPVVEGDRCPDFLAWLRWQRCAICTQLGQQQSTSSDPAHFPRTRIHGDVRNCIPLCRRHHDEHHALGTPAFCRLYHLWPRGLAWAWWDAYVAQLATAAW